MEFRERATGPLTIGDRSSDLLDFEDCASLGSSEAARRFASAVLARVSAKTSPLKPVAPPREGPSASDIAAFCDALVSEDPDAAARIIDKARHDGYSTDVLYLRFIVDAARMLGQRWVDDDASFIEVTLGLVRLHGILRALGPRFFSDRVVETNGLSALFAPAPGETHMLGITMATDFFKRAGWSVDLHLPESAGQLGDRAASGEYDLIGLSAGCRTILRELRETVAMLRDRAPGARIVIGGNIVALEPDIARRIGVDFVASDLETDAQTLRKAILGASIDN